METYGTTAKDIAPKRARLQSAQDQLAKKQAALGKAQAKLQEVLAQVASLRVSFIGSRMSRSCPLEHEGSKPGTICSEQAFSAACLPAMISGGVQDVCFCSSL